MASVYRYFSSFRQVKPCKVLTFLKLLFLRLFFAFIFLLWTQERWIDCTRQLSQWSVLIDFSSTLQYPELMLESAWKGRAWDVSPVPIEGVMNFSSDWIFWVLLLPLQGKNASGDNMMRFEAPVCTVVSTPLLMAMGSTSRPPFVVSRYSDCIAVITSLSLPPSIFFHLILCKDTWIVSAVMTNRSEIGPLK